jgi:SpoVK/Ycf46/Vps4 family AAA+-type ATPase
MDERCNRFTGADIAALTREAAIYALREAILSLDSRGHLTSHEQLVKPENLAVARRHFDFAFQKIKPSVSEQVFLV